MPKQIPKTFVEQKKTKRRKVSQACEMCRKSHVSCDEYRPCSRCVKRNMVDKCVDIIKPIPKSNSTSNLKIAPKGPEQSLENSKGTSADVPDFFEIFSSTNQLPMDDPTSVFESLSLHKPIGRKQAPSCFDGQEISNSSLIDLEELFLPVIGDKMHVCKSRGLDACLDCSFNIDNLLPQPSFIEPNDIVSSAPINNIKSEFPGSEFSVQDMSFDYHNTEHLNNDLLLLGIEIALTVHIVDLIKTLSRKLGNSDSQFNLGAYSTIFGSEFLNTPSCVFSPSGLIYCCNSAFNILTKSDGDLTRTNIYQLLDLGSILCILDTCIKPQTNGKLQYGRCNFFSNTRKQQRSCTMSLLTIQDNLKIWIVAQFIPI